jgi:dipeptidyl aminopeptidase/acylaminoacyl peptidase
MSELTITPYGSWKSPITPDLILAGAVGLGGIRGDRDDIYWIESRPAEGGRSVIVRRTPDAGPERSRRSRTADVIPAGFNARTRVHEYGGGEYLAADGVVYFANFADQRLYRCDGDAAPQPATPDAQRVGAQLRYADAVLDAGRGRLICVREDHTAAGREAVNAIVSVPLGRGDAFAAGQVLVAGNTFYASPRLSPDGARLAWLTWNHPNMPWDGCELWVAEVCADGTLAAAELVAGGLAESIFQPEWSPAGVLHFVSDRTGWWNLYFWNEGGDSSLPLVAQNDKAQVEPLCEMAAEFGLPQWVFGMSTYAFVAAERIVCAYTQAGVWRLALLDTAAKTLMPFELPYTEIGGVRAVASGVAFIAASPTQAAAIVRLDPRTGQTAVLRRSSEVTVDPGYLSTPQPVEFPTEGGLTAHALYYPPANRDHCAPDGERPPLLVLSHGGPTGATSAAFRLSTQFWTSRGFAVADVNYGGSTGYGRAYRERLNGNWGVVDVDDCVNVARYLAAAGLADEKRLAIRGSSAGGYTTLAALTFREVFGAGASHYGVSDLEALATDTHKFESRYLDRLVGPYPERRDLYVARSPIHFTDRLATPMILLQGLEDKVVPPSQAEVMFAAVKAKGLPVAYLPFAGEQHGFRKAENIKRAMEAELYFYSRIFGFALADPVEPVIIENL